MANEVKYTYRKKQYTYEEFMAGPGGRMSTDEAYAALDKASGATKTRRALQRAMTKLGYKLVSADANGVSFKGDSGEQSFATFGEVEKFLLREGAIKDEKAEAAKKAAAKKEQAAKKAAAKKEQAAKKAAAKKAAAKKTAAKKTAGRKPAAKKDAAPQAKRNAAEKTGRRPGRPAKAAATATAAPRKPGRPRKTQTAAAAARTTSGAAAKSARRVSVPASKNLKNSGLVIRVGRKEYTQERLKNLALDSYQYDMGGNPKGAKVELYVRAEAKKCLFVINGKEKGEFDL